MEMAEKNGHAFQVMLFHLQTAWLSEQAYDFARVRELCEPVLAQAGEAQYGLGQLLSLGLLGVAYRGLGQPERAFQCFSELTRQLDQGHVVMEWVQMPVRHSLSEYWLAQGEFARARQEAERLCQLAAPPGERTYLALGGRMLAEIALAERQWEQAERGVSQALAVLEGAEAPLAEWRVWATAARLHQRQGNKAEAQTYWARSAAVLKQLADSLREVPALRHSLLHSPPVRGVLRRARIDSPGRSHI
jgi:tetratricopeptide (TPR) repeat protein